MQFCLLLTFSGFSLAIFTGVFVTFLIVSFLGFSGDTGGLIGGGSNILLGVFSGSLL